MGKQNSLYYTGRYLLSFITSTSIHIQVSGNLGTAMNLSVNTNVEA